MAAALEHVEAEFSREGFTKAGELLVRPTTAIKMLERIEQLGIQVLAVHVWKPQQGGLAESLDYLDLTAGAWAGTTREPARESAAEARAFVTCRLPEDTAYVSFIMANPPAA